VNTFFLAVRTIRRVGGEVRLLEPCACGNAPAVYCRPDGRFAIRCPWCGVVKPRFCAAEPEAILKWNERRRAEVRTAGISADARRREAAAD
jgi:hypothetical protein